MRTVLSLLFLFCCGVAACASSPKVIIHTATGKQVSVAVELATTPEKRRLGLMYRQDLREGEGMLFLFPKEESLAFWMKNTHLSLDLIFINRTQQIVSIVKEATPYSEKLLPSGQPAQFVLEVLAGFCQRKGIEVGDRVEFHFPYDRVEH
jgi:uncharacterized membrane protein (UPF0127 family)